MFLGRHFGVLGVGLSRQPTHVFYLLLYSPPAHATKTFTPCGGIFGRARVVIHPILLPRLTSVALPARILLAATKLLFLSSHLTLTLTSHSPPSFPPSPPPTTILPTLTPQTFLALYAWHACDACGCVAKWLVGGLGRRVERMDGEQVTRGW